MSNEKLKRIMTDLAAGHITQKQADEMIGQKPADPKKFESHNPVKEKTQTRRTKSLGGKK